MNESGARRSLLGLIGIALLTLLAGACGGEAEPPATAPAPEATAIPEGERSFLIVMGEMFFEPNVITVLEGQEVTFELVNEGQVDHEFLVGRGVRLEKGVPEGYEQDFFEGIDARFSGDGAELEAEEHGTEVYAEPGGSGVLTFRVPDGAPGEWEIGCFVPGHYEAGMRGQLLVEG